MVPRMMYRIDRSTKGSVLVAWMELSISCIEQLFLLIKSLLYHIMGVCASD